MLRGLTTLPQPIACVFGDLNLVRPLAQAGIECAVPSNRGAVRYSRLVRQIIDLAGADSPDDVVRRLQDFGSRQPEPPVLYYQADADLLMVSRHRSLLVEHFRFLIPGSELVEDLTNKIRWSGLAERLELPVPATIPLDLEADTADLPFPIVVKPAAHDPTAQVGESRFTKAVAIRSHAHLMDRSSQLRAIRGSLVAQQLIEGPESNVESYHVYVDSDGRIAGEFTGRKIRTLPRHFGTTTALEVVDRPDVRKLGREVVERLGLLGVAKLDFKRGPDGRLWLLEVNARFTLWNHAGAAAGVNIPALVWADLAGHPRPRAGIRRSRTTWWHFSDLRARKAWGLSLAAGIRFALSAQTRSGLAWDDPLPILRGVAGMAGRRVSGALSRYPRAAKP